jgi:hyperosmotically inducible periplasmic protein
MLRKSAILCSVVAVLTFAAACAQTDAGITTSVKSKLAADDMVKASQVDVTTQDHVVTLTGRVDNAAAKERAVTIARETKGVTSVVDNLTIAERTAPTSGTEAPAPTDVPRDRDQGVGAKAKEKAGEAGDVMSDAGITAAVKTKLLGDTKTPGLKIDVDTTNGVVTLTGEVANAAERTNAVKIAQETKGVKKVVNKLTIAKKS